MAVDRHVEPVSNARLEVAREIAHEIPRELQKTSAHLAATRPIDRRRQRQVRTASAHQGPARVISITEHCQCRSAERAAVAKSCADEQPWQRASREGRVRLDATPSSGLRSGDALLVVDVQNDFLPGGALAVPDGSDVLAPLNAWIARFVRAGLPVFASRDWHPPDHCSFRAQGGLWPPHCVAGTAGAAFPPLLELPVTTRIITKAMQARNEAYSAFTATDLDAQLKSAAVQRLFVGGLATDYCVLDTVCDALQLGYGVMLLGDAVRAVDIAAGDGARAIAAMRAAGAIVLKGAEDA